MCEDVSISMVVIDEQHENEVSEGMVNSFHVHLLEVLNQIRHVIFVV